MNEVNLLDMEIGSDLKNGTITSQYVEEINGDKPKKKLVLKINSDGFEYTVSEVWVQDHKKDVVAKGLWLNYDNTGMKLHSTCAITWLLRKLNITKVSDMIGKEVTIRPKENNFMAIVLNN